MQQGLKFAVVSAIFLMLFAYPHSALSWELELNFLSYQEATWMCRRCRNIAPYPQTPTTRIPVPLQSTRNK
jgi:hypothetical protein